MKMSDEKMDLKVEVDEEVCIGCSLCQTYFPEVFEDDLNGHSKVKKDAKINENEIKQMIKDCPSCAIYFKK